MDKKIAILSAFRFLEDARSQIREKDVQNLKVIISWFTEGILSDDEYQLLLDTLEEDQYITQTNAALDVTRQGIALAQSIGERVLGSTALARLERMISDYTRNETRYLANLNEQLKNSLTIIDQKVSDVDKDSIRATGFIIRVQHKSPKLHRHDFVLDDQIMRNEDALGREINYAVRNCVKEVGQPIIAQRDGNILKVVSASKLPTFAIFNQQLVCQAVELVKREDIADWTSVVVSFFMERKLHTLGYIRSNWPGRTFVKYGDFERTKTNVGSLRESEALQLDFVTLSVDEVFVWIETYTSPTKRVLDFLLETVGNNADKQQMLDSLEGLKLRSIPSGNEIELKDVIASKSMVSDTIPSMNRTYNQHWERVYGITLAQEIQPILVVEGINHDFHYPAEMVFIDKYSLEKRLGGMQRKPKPESPKHRFEKVQDLFFSIKDISSDTDQSFNISLRRFAPTVKELCTWDMLQDACRISPPILEFHGGAVSIDPRDIFDRQVIPVCGRKNVKVAYLVLPDNFDDASANSFLRKFQQAFSSYGFGNIQQVENLKTIRYAKDADIQSLENEIRSLSKIESDEANIAFAITPDDNSAYYYSLKRLMPARTRIPLQCIQISTFQDILSGTFRGFQFLSMKVMIKVLQDGESIWNLNRVAGLSDEKSLFVGIGFSRFPRERKVSKCAAVLHNARGDRVSWKVFATLQERNISKQWFDNLLRRVRDVIERERPSRLVFYRTGQMYSPEREAIISSLSENNWLSAKISFVSVMDGHNYRFYLYDKEQKKYNNLPAGHTIIINENEALLSSSNYDGRRLRQGTVVPVWLKREIGDDPIIDLVKEYHDLTYLNWQAPATTAKSPLVITLAERFAELTREGVSAENMFYLDM